MNPASPSAASRREFLKNTGRVAAVGALAGVVAPSVHAAENNTIQVALVGCGGRGTGAANDAMSVKNGPVKLVAMADVFADRLNASHENLSKQCGDKMDVPKERQFVGFDAYQKAMDCLDPGGIAIFANPLAFRAINLQYAIQKGLHAFMEKPLSADGPTSRKLLDLAKQADAKNLKAAVGLMSRHARHLQQLAERIHNGDVGEIHTIRAYRQHGPAGSFFSERKPAEENELLWQIRRFHSFLWASGGAYSDANIHLIDHCCWMKNAWPTKAKAIGGRHFRNGFVDQNFDSYGVEYTFPDDTKMFFSARYIAGCADEYASYADASNGFVVMSKSGDCGAPSAIYKGHAAKKSEMVWESKTPADEGNPYQNEWNDFIDAIRADKPYNEVPRGVEASVATSMGRMAAHTGRVISFEDMLNCPHEMAPGIDTWTNDSPAPVLADANGVYPSPQPGIVTDKEY